MKPIAIITANLPAAYNYMNEKIKVKDFNKSHRKFTDINDQIYLIFTDEYQMRGFEFSDIWIVPGASDNPNYIEMYDYAKLRVK